MSKSLKNKLSCSSCCGSKSLYNFEPGSTTNTSTNQSLESFLNDITPNTTDITGGGGTGGGTTVTIPDPLTINNLIVIDTAQLTDVIVSGSLTTNNITSTTSLDITAPNGINLNSQVNATNINNNIAANSLIFTQSIAPQVNVSIPSTSLVQVTEPVGPGGVIFYDGLNIKGVTDVPLINEVLQYDGSTLIWAPSPGVANVSLEQAYYNGPGTGSFGSIKLSSAVGPILIKESDTLPINNILFEITGPNPVVNVAGNNFFSVSDLNIIPDVTVGSNIQSVNFTVNGSSLLGGFGNSLTNINNGGILGGVNNIITSTGLGSFVIGGVNSNINITSQGTCVIGNSNITVNSAGSTSINADGTLGNIGDTDLILVGGSNTVLNGSSNICVGPSSLSCNLEPSVPKLFLKDNPIIIRENTTFVFPTLINGLALSKGFVRLNASGSYNFDSTINIRNILLDSSGSIFSANFTPTFTVIFLNASLGIVDISLGAGQTLTNGSPPILIGADESKTLTFWFTSNNTIRIEDLTLVSFSEPFYTTNNRAIISGSGNNNIAVSATSFGSTVSGINNVNTINSNTGGLILGGSSKTVTIGGLGNTSISAGGTVGTVLASSNLVLIGGSNTTMNNSNSICIGSTALVCNLQPTSGKLFLKDNPVMLKENTVYNAFGLILATDISKGFVQLNANGAYTLDTAVNIRNVLLDNSGGALGATFRPVFNLVLYNSSVGIVTINIGVGKALTNGVSPISINSGQSKTWSLWFTTNTTMLIEDMSQSAFNEPLFTTNNRAIISGLSNNIGLVNSLSYGGIFGGTLNNATINANTGSVNIGGSNKTVALTAAGSVSINAGGIIGSSVLNNNLLLIGGDNTQIFGTNSMSIGPSTLTTHLEPSNSKLFLKDNPVYLKENTVYGAAGVITALSISKGFVELTVAGAYTLDSTVNIRNALLDSSATPFVGNIRPTVELVIYNTSGATLTVAIGAGQTLAAGSSPYNILTGESRTLTMWFTSITTMVIQDQVLNALTSSGVTTLSPVGGPAILVANGIGPNLTIRSLSASIGIALSSTATTVTIHNTSPNTSVTLNNTGGTSLVNSGAGPVLAIKGLVAGSGIGIVDGGTTLTISSTTSFGTGYLFAICDYASLAGAGASVYVNTTFNNILIPTNWSYTVGPNYTNFSNPTTCNYHVIFSVQAVIPNASCFTLDCYNSTTASVIFGSQTSYRNDTGTTINAVSVVSTFVIPDYTYTGGDILNFRFVCSAIGSSLNKNPAGAPATAGAKCASLIIQRLY